MLANVLFVLSNPSFNLSSTLKFIRSRFWLTLSFNDVKFSFNVFDVSLLKFIKDSVSLFVFLSIRSTVSSLFVNISLNCLCSDSAIFPFTASIKFKLFSLKLIFSSDIIWSFELFFNCFISKKRFVVINIESIHIII